VKILIHGLNTKPELIGVGKYTGEMAEWLAAHGHEVRVVTAYPYYPQWQIADACRGRWWTREADGGVRVLRCPLYVPRRPGAARRSLHLLTFAVSSAPIVLWQALAWRPDVIVGVEPTLFAAPATLAAARLSGAAAWLHVQDFEIEAAFATGLVTSARLARWSVALESALLRRFDRVSTISPAMCAHAERKGVAAARIALLPNWAATETLYPLDGPSPMRRELGIAPDVAVALYAGNMSEKQGLETLVVAARELAGDERIRFVFAGDGAARRRLETMGATLGNVTFLPLQPVERLNDLLNLADIHLLPQRQGVADLVMPSKLLGMMSSGRPVVAGALSNSALGRAVATCGLVVAPEDGAAMAAAVRALAGDGARRAMLGRAGRERVVAEWSRDAVLGEFLRRLGEMPTPRRAVGRGAVSRLAGSPE
jgi:colanic acid biosynthesis glycosyl transferase WcaI